MEEEPYAGLYSRVGVGIKDLTVFLFFPFEIILDLPQITKQCREFCACFTQLPPEEYVVQWSEVEPAQEKHTGHSPDKSVSCGVMDDVISSQWAKIGDNTHPQMPTKAA